MIAKATLRYIRISPRKFRQIIPLIKGRQAEEAIAILGSLKKRASQYAIELLKSAMANAKHLQGVDISALCISKLEASGGPMLKRFRAASMGRASMIRKRTSHITLELDKISPAAQEAVKIAKHEGMRKSVKAQGRETEKGSPKKTRVKESKAKELNRKNKG